MDALFYCGSYKVHAITNYLDHFEYSALEICINFNYENHRGIGT